uniref:Embryo surrounding factor 1 brassicaceae domain-containing protein n=1 Tax=Aegilops tauschii subsp. strangulata TaxID=200361 RepID=A0A453RCZ1_AEGTS
MKGSSVVSLIAVLIIGCLFLVGQCRPEPESTSEDGHANATMAVSSLDESKLTIKFCVIRDCQTKGEYYGFVGCYCCFSLKGVRCYDTVGECQKICPAQSP